MKLWELRPVEDLPPNDNPWHPWYDKSFGYIVRAEDETQARAIIDSGGDECDEFNPWLDENYTTCVEITSEGEAKVIMEDFHAA